MIWVYIGLGLIVAAALGYPLVFRRFDWGRRYLRSQQAMEYGQWFRLGYLTALDDRERSGLTPITDETKRHEADRALRRWVDRG